MEEKNQSGIEMTQVCPENGVECMCLCNNNTAK